jgi:beta-phosphoglucomutase
MNRFRACLFDLDGVLVDTARFHFQAWQELAESLGIPFSEADNEHLKGVSRVDSLEFILRLGHLELDSVTKQRLMDAKNARYLDLVAAMAPADVLPGVIGFLDSASEAGILLGVGSSSKNAVSILERIGLVDRFATVMDGNRITLSKPDPQVFLFGAAALNTPPSECIVFEDAPAGIAAARAGGFTAVGIGPDGSLPTAHLTVPGFAGLSWQGLLDLIQ